ncbi:MAG: tetratricopeptide repeat protein, partial [Candidatus Paceibacterota bacterium]
MKNKLFYKILFIVLGVIILGTAIWYTVERKNDLPPLPSAIGEAFDSGNFDQAIALSNEILTKDPKNVYALVFLSQTYAQKGSLEFKEKEFGQKAIEYANQAIAISPDNGKAYIALGYANEIMQQYDASISAYNKAVSLEPDNADTYSHRGHAYD